MNLSVIVSAATQGPQLRPAQRKALADALRDFVLGGAELKGADRERSGRHVPRPPRDCGFKFASPTPVQLGVLASLK